MIRFSWSYTSPIFALAMMLVGLGCAPGADAAAGDTNDSKPAASPSESAATGGGNANAATVAEWRSTVARLRGELGDLTRDTAGLSAAARGRVQRISEELAALEKQLAASGAARSARKIEGGIEAKPPVGDARRDEDVKPAKFDAPTITDTANHPFAPAIRRAKATLDDIAKIKDYTAVIVKRERINGELLVHEYMYAKIRHEPFSVYLRFLGPEHMKDREVIYVDGKNDGKLLAVESPNRKGVIGLFAPLVGTTPLDPKSALAMAGNRYPITEIGVLNLTKRLIEVGERDMQFGGAVAKFYPNAKVEKRPCEAYVFLHPQRDGNRFRFHRAEVFIDKELNLPVRYASYDWPQKAGEEGPLMEEYTYTHMKRNVGLKDEDFDVKNPQYRFPK